jgi:hypothetical protein
VGSVATASGFSGRLTLVCAFGGVGRVKFATFCLIVGWETEKYKELRGAIVSASDALSELHVDGKTTTM